MSEYLPDPTKLYGDPKILVRSQQTQKQMVLVTIVGIFLAIALMLGFLSVGEEPIEAPVVGQRLSDFSGQDIEGNDISLKDYRGNVVLLVAWTTWCPYCREELSDLNAYYKKHRDDGFMVLALNAGEVFELVEIYARDNKIRYPILLDPGKTLTRGLNISSYPTSILIDREGIVVDLRVGMLTRAQVASIVNPILIQP